MRTTKPRPERVPIQAKRRAKLVVVTLTMGAVAVVHDRGYRSLPETATVRKPSPSSPYRLFVGAVDVAGLNADYEPRLAGYIAHLEALHPPFTTPGSVTVTAKAVGADVAITIEGRYPLRDGATTPEGRKAIAMWCGAMTHLPG